MQTKFNSLASSVIQLTVLFTFVVDHVWSVKFVVGSKYSREAQGVYEFVQTQFGEAVYRQARSIIPINEAEPAVLLHLEASHLSTILSSRGVKESIVGEIIVSDLVKHANYISEGVPNEHKEPRAIVLLASEIGYWNCCKFVWIQLDDKNFIMNPVAGVPKTNLNNEFERAHFVKHHTKIGEMMDLFGEDQSTSWMPSIKTMAQMWAMHHQTQPKKQGRH